MTLVQQYVRITGISGNLTNRRLDKKMTNTYQWKYLLEFQCCYQLAFCYLYVYYLSAGASHQNALSSICIWYWIYDIWYRYLRHFHSFAIAILLHWLILCETLFDQPSKTHCLFNINQCMIHKHITWQNHFSVEFYTMQGSMEGSTDKQRNSHNWKHSR